jgi:beta-glucosidase/6-phospho-beta-glucosidase/beta-galactosidase
MLVRTLRWGLGLAVAAVAGCGSEESARAPDARIGTFPAGFLGGSATAAYQAESVQPPATDWSVWETMPGKVKNGDRSADGPDEWEHFDDDFALAQAMGQNAYRFSIEWARIEPRPGTFDEDAIAHYRALIASMKSHGLRPIVTLWHFTNPTWVQDPLGGDSLGGWEAQATASAYVCALGDDAIMAIPKAP